MSGLKSYCWACSLPCPPNDKSLDVSVPPRGPQPPQLHPCLLTQFPPQSQGPCCPLVPHPHLQTGLLPCESGCPWTSARGNPSSCTESSFPKTLPLSVSPAIQQGTRAAPWLLSTPFTSPVNTRSFVLDSRFLMPHLGGSYPCLQASALQSVPTQRPH